MAAQAASYSNWNAPANHIGDLVFSASVEAPPKHVRRVLAYRRNLCADIVTGVIRHFGSDTPDLGIAIY